MFSSGPRYDKLTANLKLAINRLKLIEKKKMEMAVKSRREIGEYIKNGKMERARIRVEHIIREDYMVEAMEIVEMYCDLLLARMGILRTSKELDGGMEEPISSLIWTSNRLYSEVAELKVISEQLTLKYGKEFSQACRNNTLSNVNEKLINRLSIHAPPQVLVEKYMKEIAQSYNIDYIPLLPPPTNQADILLNDPILAAEINSSNLAKKSDFLINQKQDNFSSFSQGNKIYQYNRNDLGHNIGLFQATNMGHVRTERGNIGHVLLPNAPNDTISSNTTFNFMNDLNSNNINNNVNNNNNFNKDNNNTNFDDFNDLTRRFEQLKKKK